MTSATRFSACAGVLTVIPIAEVDNAIAAMIDKDTLNKVIRDAKKHGNSYFGILGGEPFLHPDLLDVLDAHPDCYFQIFTNGQLITEAVAKRLRKAGNATPLISVEGSATVSDERRGRLNVLNRTMMGIENCRKEGLITGVATSVCQTNIKDLLSEAWLKRLIELGVHYAWFHTYRPVGPEPTVELALTPEQILQVRRFIVTMRTKLPIAIVDPYWDHNGQALCPMATELPKITNAAIGMRRDEHRLAFTNISGAMMI